MPTITDNIVVVLLTGLLVVALIVIMVMARSKRNEFSFNVFKGLLDFKGSSDSGDLKDTDNPCDLAERIMAWIREKLKKVDGSYIVTDTTLENAKVAANLYTKLEGKIIATAFFESPDYGPGDFANTISSGATFYRVTTSDLCDEHTTNIVNERFSTFQCNGKLVVLPQQQSISKIAGIFCKLTDGSYLAFIALNNVGNKGNNRGLIFSGSVATQLFEYYESFTK